MILPSAEAEVGSLYYPTTRGQKVKKFLQFSTLQTYAQSNRAPVKDFLGRQRGWVITCFRASTRPLFPCVLV